MDRDDLNDSEWEWGGDGAGENTIGMLGADIGHPNMGYASQNRVGDSLQPESGPPIDGNSVIFDDLSVFEDSHEEYASQARVRDYLAPDSGQPIDGNSALFGDLSVFEDSHEELLIDLSPVSSPSRKVVYTSC